MRPKQWIGIIIGVLLIIIPLGYLTYLKGISIDMTNLRFKLTYGKEIVISIIMILAGSTIIKRIVNKI